MYTFKELVQELESERDTDAMGYQGLANEHFVDYAFEPAVCAYGAGGAGGAGGDRDADSEDHGIRQTRFSDCNTSTSRCAPLQFPAKRNRQQQQQQQQADGGLQQPSQPQATVFLKKPKLGEWVAAVEAVEAVEAVAVEEVAPRTGGTVM